MELTAINFKTMFYLLKSSVINIANTLGYTENIQ